MEKISIKYKKGFVAFIDVLGFADMINNPTDISKQKIEDYLNIVDEQFKRFDSSSEFKSIVISDSIILSLEISGNNTEANTEALTKLCKTIKLIQQKLALHNIWVRGGVSYGDIYFDNERKQVIGKGYINAFYLERDYAIYPRVILDNKIVGFLGFKTSEECICRINELEENLLYRWERDFHKVKDQHKIVYGIKKDVSLFIDFIDMEDMKNLSIYANFIIDNANENIKIYPKYLWLAQYIISKWNWDSDSQKIISMLKEV